MAMTANQQSPTNAENDTFGRQNMGYLTQLLSQLGLRQGSVQDNAIKILNSLQQAEQTQLKPSELLKAIGVSKSSFYHLLHFLQGWGLIRKRGTYWTLDSEFSARCIRYTSFWINYAGIKRNQPEKVRELINQLI